MEKDKLTTTIDKDQQKNLHITPVIDDHLKTFASIIIERIVEDTQNGRLRFKTKPNT